MGTPCPPISIFLIFFEQVFFVFVGILFPLEDASQICSKTVLAEHVKDVQ